jgi:hypothetical protein
MKRFLLLSFLILTSFAAFAQSGSLDVYVELYNRSTTWQDKLAILNEITASNLDGSVNFYAKAFNELNMHYRNIKSGSTEWTAANNIAHIYIAKLVEARHEASGDDFWRCYQLFTDSTVQAEALVALGELKIESHFGDIERVLNQLNAKTNTTNRQNDENIAAGGFVALEKYGKPEGYLVAFVGSEGWYREVVKQTARSALNVLLQDPSNLLHDVVQSSYYPNTLKYAALDYIDHSSLSNEQKADFASRSLVQAWRSYSNDQRVQREFTDFRRLALNMIRNYGSNATPAVYQAMERSLRQGNLDEKLDCIPALGALKTPEALNIIVSYVQILNDNRRLSNSQSIDDRLMRSLVPAIGESGDSSVRDMLYQVQAAPWSNTVLGLARDALAKLN